VRRRLPVAILVLALSMAPPPAAAEAPCPPSAGVPTAAEIRQAMRTARDRGALWRLEKDGRHGWLYGTIHVGKLAWAVPGRTVIAALHDAETIVLEADPLDPSFHAGVTAPPTPQEAPPLPAPLARRLQQQAVRTCVPWERLRSMPPMMIAATLTLLDAANEGLFAEYASEMMLAGYARGANKSFDTLETTAIQRSVVTGGPPADQLASVEEVVVALEKGTARKDVVTVAEAWARGDVDGLRRAVGDMPATERRGVERSVIGRNPGMVRRIDELLAAGRRPFVAAGILHMVGDAGLPALLRQRGFTVERVQFDDGVGIELPGGGGEGNPARDPLPKE
jgi:uncharacterized protein